jgi:dihydroxyacetone kinase-like protein
MVASHPEYVKRVDGCDVLVREGVYKVKVLLVS